MLRISTGKQSKAFSSSRLWMCRHVDIALRTIPDTPLSPPSSPLPGQHVFVERFCPKTSDLYDKNSVLLPVPLLTPYLDKVLKTLGLHTEARTSFITYVHNYHGVFFYRFLTLDGIT